MIAQFEKASPALKVAQRIDLKIRPLSGQRTATAMSRKNFLHGWPVFNPVLTLDWWRRPSPSITEFEAPITAQGSVVRSKVPGERLKSNKTPA